jgi:hypothetical protein
VWWITYLLLFHVCRLEENLDIAQKPFNWKCCRLCLKRLIKPSLQHFQFCLFGLCLVILIFAILSPHWRYLCRVEAVKSHPVHSIRDVIFPILKDRSARHNCCVYMLCGAFSFFFVAFYNLDGSSIPSWILYNHPYILPPFKMCLLASSLVYDMQALYSQISFQNSILFSSVHCFLVKSTCTLLLRDHTPLFMEWHYYVTLKVSC